MILFHFVDDHYRKVLVRFAFMGATLACSGCRSVDRPLGEWGATFVCHPCLATWNEWFPGSALEQARAA